MKEDDGILNKKAIKDLEKALDMVSDKLGPKIRKKDIVQAIRSSRDKR